MSRFTSRQISVHSAIPIWYMWEHTHRTRKLPILYTVYATCRLTMMYCQTATSYDYHRYNNNNNNNIAFFSQASWGMTIIDKKKRSDWFQWLTTSPWYLNPLKMVSLTFYQAMLVLLHLLDCLLLLAQSFPEARITSKQGTARCQTKDVIAFNKSTRFLPK